MYYTMNSSGTVERIHRGICLPGGTMYDCSLMHYERMKAHGGSYILMRYGTVYFEHIISDGKTISWSVAHKGTIDQQQWESLVGAGIPLPQRESMQREQLDPPAMDRSEVEFALRNFLEEVSGLTKTQRPLDK